MSVRCGVVGCVLYNIYLYNYETQHLVNALRTHASTFE